MHLSKDPIHLPSTTCPLSLRQEPLLRTVPTNKEVLFLYMVYDYVGKPDLSEGYWNQKRKFGLTMHILEIIKQHVFLKTVKYRALWRFFFFKLKFYYLWKTHGCPKFSFLSTCWVLLSPLSFKPRKNIPVLVGTTHRKPEYLKMRSQKRLPVTKVGKPPPYYYAVFYQLIKHSSLVCSVFLVYLFPTFTKAQLLWTLLTPLFQQYF